MTEKNVEGIEFFLKLDIRTVPVMEKKKKSPHHSLFPYSPAFLHKCESFSESDCDIFVCILFKVNSFNLFPDSYYFLSPPLR